MISGVDQKAIITLLKTGEIDVTGQFMWGSNYTFLCNVTGQEQVVQGVYKPVRGERPLWDFPSETLSGREVAAYLLSEAGGWHLVPPTVFRRQAPAGPGSLQLFIEHDPDYHYYQFSPDDISRTRPVALFDVVLNNTDRKAGHILVDQDEKFWLIDHGVCFHVEPKLRTVIWDFAGMPLKDDEITQLTDLKEKLVSESDLIEQLSRYLTHRENQAIVRRIDDTIQSRKFPEPRQDRYSTPWPPV